VPNWCSNHVEINGPKEKIKDLFDVAKNGDGLLEAMAPLGKWDYHDAIHHWGTKWDINVSESGLAYLDHNDKTGSIRGYFESAWSPPEQAMFTYMDNNPDVDIELFYYEPSMDFAGSLRAGTIEISKQNKDFWLNTDIGVALDNHFGVIDMLEEYEEEVQEEVLAEPPDVLHEI
tara:strand:- start:461 stop:982 length:522 start_codon:yes stop_codon:yes gene_type:complete